MRRVFSTLFLALGLAVFAVACGSDDCGSDSVPSNSVAVVTHPKNLEEHERVLPGSAECVFSMAEREQIHRHGVEDRAMNIEESRDKRGQVFGLIIVLAAFGVSLWLGLADHEIAAAVIGGAGLTTLVGLFLDWCGRGHRVDRVQKGSGSGTSPCTLPAEPDVPDRDRILECSEELAHRSIDVSEVSLMLATSDSPVLLAVDQTASFPCGAGSRCASGRLASTPK